MSTTALNHEDFPTLVAGAPAEDPSRILKKGDVFALFDRFGDLSPERSAGKAGVYRGGTRFLSRYELTLCSQRPLLLRSEVSADSLQLDVDLMNPDCTRDRELVLAKGTLHIHRTLLLLEDGVIETLSITNFARASITARIELRADADFRDIFEVRGVMRANRGAQRPPQMARDSAGLSYLGLDGVERRTSARFTPRAEGVSPGAVAFEPLIAPSSTFAIKTEIVFAEGAAAASAAERTAAVATIVAQRDEAEPPAGAHLVTSSQDFNALIHQCERDLRMLTTATTYGAYPYAGVPWYATIFGRDGIIAALQRLWLDPGLARGVLANLAASQAQERDPATEAEPGKIVHELRSGEMANRREIPFGRYYGSVDSTPLFVVLAGAYLKRTDDLAFIRTIWPNIVKALEWIDYFGDLDGDGFVEYPARPEQALVNQCWKDSGDSIFHEDGSLAAGPLAVCEVQAYVYAARRAARRVAAALGEQALADVLASQAAALRENFDRAFWLEDLGLYALALDGEKRPCAVRTSNAGHCLATRIALDNRALRIAEQMMSPAFYTGWGVRTVAASERAYNPMSYHSGSVWPHDSAMIARGLARYGRKAQAATILAGLIDLSRHIENFRLPELICGFERRSGVGPTQYPVTCIPQAWAAGAIFMIIESCLGVSIRAQAREIRLRQPHLPDFLSTLSIMGLRVGEAEVDLTFTRSESGTKVSIDRSTGSTRIRVIG